MNPSTSSKAKLPDEPASSKSESTSTSKPKEKPKAKPASRTAPLLYRRRAPSTVVTPLSPPPSIRKKATAPPLVAVASARKSPPVTPKSKRPVRDSPNNPFLDESPTEDLAETEKSAGSSPRTPKKERPTVTYVFRGVRGTFPNPLYDHERGRPISPSTRSRLPIEHPDFSPSQHCPPKLLFPRARTSKRKPTTPQKKTLEQELRKSERRRRSVTVSGSESEGEDEKPIVAKKLDFTEEKTDVNLKPKGPKDDTSSDLLRKAVGPVR